MRCAGCDATKAAPGLRALTRGPSPEMVEAALVRHRLSRLVEDPQSTSGNDLPDAGERHIRAERFDRGPVLPRRREEQLVVVAPGEDALLLEVRILDAA